MRPPLADTFAEPHEILPQRESMPGASGMVERVGYPLFWALNAIVLVALHHFDLLSPISVIAVHVVNIVGLAVLEVVTPLNPRWLLVREGRVRWRLLAKTYVWYVFDSQVWFRAHGAAIAAVGVWIAQSFAADASRFPAWAQFIGFALFIDFARYWIHRGQHTFLWLWRWHTMHHAPTHLTPVRAWWTHPVDDVILYSLEILLMVTLGLDPAVVLAYVSIDNSFQLLNHANVRLHNGWLGVVFQHPRYHLLHHRRLEPGEQTANFGEMLTLWDRAFGTFAAQSLDQMRTLEIGILPVKRRTLWHQLSAPFHRRVDEI